MAVRIFLTDYRSDPGYNANPVVDWIDQNLSGAQIQGVANIWPSLEVNGRPSKASVYTIAWGDPVALATVPSNVPKTYLFTPRNGAALVSSLSNNDKNAINSELNSRGFGSLDPFAGSATWRDVLDKIAKAFDPNSNVFAHVTDAELA